MNEFFTQLSALFSDTIELLPEFRGEITWKVSSSRIINLLSELKNHADFKFESLIDLTAVDLSPINGTIEVVYHLFSHTHKKYLRIKTSLPSDAPVISSAASLWRSADWLEREAFDLLGVRFVGHPDLRRLLMPDDYNGFPLLKEHPLCPQGDCDDA